MQIVDLKFTFWRLLLLIFIAVELLSLTAYFFSWMNAVGFLLLTVLALILSIQKLEYGLYFILAELILGGKGYLFSMDFNGTTISLRMGLFVVVMAVWAARVLPSLICHRERPRICGGAWRSRSWTGLLLRQLADRNDIRGGWWLLGVVVVWGLIVGFLRGNDFSNLFLDANGYFYVAMILPFIWVMQNRNGQNSAIAEKSPLEQNLTTIFFTATTWLAVKTLLTVYFLTHVNNIFFDANLESFYRWVRDTGVGEITWLPGNFARVFFQSHIYNIAAFFVLLASLIQNKIHASIYDRKQMREFLCPTILLALNFAVIIVSLSRSFWVGVIIGLVIIIYFAWRQHYLKRLSSTILINLVLTGLMLIVVARFPLPRPSVLDLSAATKSRLEFEAAASSRWNLLPPLWQAIKKHPVLGSGFGATVTYISNDPRVRETNPTGEYTTYAFEWGWLDLWLKFGILGLAAYFLLLYQLAKHFWQIKNEALSIASLAIIFSLVAIHFFTPYLNHPLGFGLIMLLTIISLRHFPESSDSPAKIPAHS